MPSSAPEDRADRTRDGLREPESRAPQEAALAPFRLSRYDLQQRIGEGATAVVFAARDRELQRDVAIKVLRESIGMSEVARERFRREAQAAAQLSHPNLVTVYDAGTVDGQAYLVMERVQGKSLGDFLRERPGHVRDHVRILERAARGVAAAHEKGIVHRDLKPANILMSTHGEPKVGDFGMAHLMDSRLELTKTGVPLGTPLYMAPEQVQGGAHDITPRTDVYGLGAILYEILVGRPPHVADSIILLYGKIAREDPAAPRSLNPKVPPELEAIALKALDREPDRRYATAALFADDLARFLEGKPILARRASPAYRLYRRLRSHRGAIAAAAAALIALLGVAFAGERRARALEQDRLREREAAEEKLRRASQTSLEVSRAREDSLRRLSYLWGRMVAVQEWRQQLSRKPAEIRRELEGLVQEASKFIADYPELPQGYYVRARAHFFAGNTKRAEADLTTALDRHPDFSPGWAMLAHVKMEIYLDRGYAWSPQDRVNRKLQAEPILREAEEAMRRCDGGAPGKAASERWGLSWTREDAVNETIILALMECYIEQKREAAKARLQKAHAEIPSAEFCDLLGNWSGDVRLALPLLDQAIALSPNWARPYVDRAVVRGIMGEREKAIEDLTRAIELNPNFAIAYDNRAFYRAQLKDFDGAIGDCDRALELEPRMDSAFVHRAEARQAKGDHPGAVRDATEAVNLHPGYSTAWLARSKSLLALGELERADSDVAKAIEIDATHPGFFVQRALVAIARKDFKAVVECCDKALQVAPPNWEYRAAIEQLKAQARGR